MSITVHGSVFHKPGEVGDFAWMIDRTEYDDVLFVFNDNEEQFRAFQTDPTGGRGCSRGGGNAVIRPWRCADPPRAAGIPTGTLARGGYPALDPEARAAIDDAFALIDALLGTGRYRRVFFSATPDGGLGTGIFTVGDPVRADVLTGLRARARPGPDAPSAAP